jgi:hypothetical protein
MNPAFIQTDDAPSAAADKSAAWMNPICGLS